MPVLMNSRSWEPRPAPSARTLKNLKAVVLLRFRQAAAEGRLRDLFDDAGYRGELLGWRDHTFKSFAYNTDTVSLPLPQSLIIEEKWQRRKRTGRGT